MRVVVAVALLSLVGLTTLVLGNPAQVGGQTVAPPPVVSGESQGLITLASPPVEGIQQFTVVDPSTRAMAVYHVDLKGGQITLKSVRNLRWDLQLEDFNGVTPKAREVRIQVQGN